jgi:hypothetical protein
MPGQSIRPHPNSDDYLLRPFRADRVYCNAIQAKAWAKFSRPFGPKLTPKSERRPRLQSFLRASRLPRWERYRDWAYFVFSHLLFVIISWLS